MTSAQPSPPRARVLYVAEPSALWIQRPPVVADCSVVAALVFAEPACEDAAALLSHKAVHAPALLPFEVANVARSKRRAGMPPAAMEDALRDFAEQRIALHPVPADAMAQLALRYELSTYDAATCGWRPSCRRHWRPSTAALPTRPASTSRPASDGLPERERHPAQPLPPSASPSDEPCVLTN